VSTDESQFPAYFRNTKKKLEKVEWSKEVETGRGGRVLDDKRPLIMEYWYDSDTALDFVTAFYSSKGIEEWSGNEHKAYLVRNGVMKSSDHVPSTFIFEDDAGNSMWSVNWAENYVSSKSAGGTNVE
jgi:hypothetical protein